MPIATKVNSIELATVRLMKALSPGTVENVKDKLVEIAQDGVITSNEKPVLEELLVGFLDNLTTVVGELRLLSQKCLGDGNEH